MPYSKCTRCGSTMHLNVANVEAWYAERYPELKVGSIVPCYCRDCFPEIEEGMRVQLRLKLGQYQVDREDEGVVEKVISSNQGNLYAVRFKKEDQDVLEIFCRPEISKVSE